MFLYIFKLFLSTRCSLYILFVFFSDYIPHFSWGSFLYIVLFLFNPNLPLFDCISDLLDTCPIRALLETLCVVVRLNITIQASFPHKFGQLVRCRTFNVVVAAFFLNISWFTVESFLRSSSSKVWLPLARYSLGNWVPTLYNTSRGSLAPQETPHARHHLSLSSTH